MTSIDFALRARRAADRAYRAQRIERRNAPDRQPPRRDVCAEQQCTSCPFATRTTCRTSELGCS